MLVSPATNVASDWNATDRPSALSEGSWLEPLPCMPSLATLAARLAGLPVVREHVKDVRVAGDQSAGERRERDVAPVRALSDSECWCYCRACRCWTR